MEGDEFCWGGGSEVRVEVLISCCRGVWERNTGTYGRRSKNWPNKEIESTQDNGVENKKGVQRVDSSEEIVESAKEKGIEEPHEVLSDDFDGEKGENDLRVGAKRFYEEKTTENGKLNY